jgi:hypothetical protein
MKPVAPVIETVLNAKGLQNNMIVSRPARQTFDDNESGSEFIV